MIQSFKDEVVRNLFEGGSSRHWGAIQTAAKRKLDQLEAASQLGDLRIPRGNHLEALKGDRAGQYSIRINDQYRICFEWKADGAHNVEITDYH